MESATLRKWLAERGCAFDQQAVGHGARLQCQPPRIVVVEDVGDHLADDHRVLGPVLAAHPDLGHHPVGLQPYRLAVFALVLAVGTISLPDFSAAQTIGIECVPSPYGCPGDSSVTPSNGGDNYVVRPAPVAGPAQRAAALNNEGVALFNRRDYAAAVAKLKQAVAMHGTNKLIRANLAFTESFVLYNRGDFAGAAKKLTQARALNPSNKVIQSNLAHAEALILFKSGDYVGAMTKFKRAITLNPSNKKNILVDMATAASSAGLQLLKRGDVEGAAKTYCDAVQFDPSKAAETMLGQLKAAIRKWGKKFEVRTPSCPGGIRN